MRAVNGPGERSSTEKMWGEFFREAAVLVIVFGILDKVIENHAISVAYGGAILAVSSLLLGSGMWLERTRKE